MEYEGVLRDGTRVLFRPIRPDDKDALRAGFEQLSPESRYRRFFRPIDHLSEKDLRYLTEVDFKDHFAWLAVLPDAPGSPGAGVARWIRIPGEPAVAEGAITVVDSMHNQGIGTMLLWLLGRSAIERGIEAIRVWVQGENHPMLDLLKNIGAKPKGWEGGVAEMDIPLPPTVDRLPIPATAVLKAVARGAGYGEAEGQTRAGTRLVPPDDAGAPDRT